MYADSADVMQWVTDSNLLEMIVDKLSPSVSTTSCYMLFMCIHTYLNWKLICDFRCKYMHDIILIAISSPIRMISHVPSTGSKF